MVYPAHCILPTVPVVRGSTYLDSFAAFGGILCTDMQIIRTVMLYSPPGSRLKPCLLPLDRPVLARLPCAPAKTSIHAGAPRFRPVCDRADQSRNTKFYSRRCLAWPSLTSISLSGTRKSSSVFVVRYFKSNCSWSQMSPQSKGTCLQTRAKISAGPR